MSWETIGHKQSRFIGVEKFSLVSVERAKHGLKSIYKYVEDADTHYILDTFSVSFIFDLKSIFRWILTSQVMIANSFTYPKAGLAAGANAVAEATTAAKQNAVFMVKLSKVNQIHTKVIYVCLDNVTSIATKLQYNTNAREQRLCSSRTPNLQKHPVWNTYLPWKCCVVCVNYFSIHWMNLHL